MPFPPIARYLKRSHTATIPAGNVATSNPYTAFTFVLFTKHVVTAAGRHLYVAEMQVADHVIAGITN